MRQISKDNLDEVQLGAFLERFRRFAPRRWVVILPMVAWLFLSLLAGDQSVWRMVVLGMVVVTALLGMVLELLHGNSVELKWKALRGSTWLTLLATLMMGVFALATGGFDSPILPFIIPVCFFVGMFGAPGQLIPTAAASTLVIVVLTLVSARGWIPDLMPALFGGGASLPQPPVLLYTKAAVLVGSLGWSAVIANGLRHVFRHIVGDVLDARDEVLEGHEAQARELTTLSGELAHEPLGGDQEGDAGCRYRVQAGARLHAEARLGERAHVQPQQRRKREGQWQRPVDGVADPCVHRHHQDVDEPHRDECQEERE